MKIRLSFSGAALAVLLAAVALAARPVRPAEEQKKIDFLIEEIRKSDDVFIRNGKEYSGKRASAHIAQKLRFAGKRVQTATDFILGIASKSEQSGKPYEVRSRDGKTREPLRDWLLARLHLYEKANPVTPTPVAPRVP